jgi:hypothetical protein
MRWEVILSSTYQSVTIGTGRTSGPLPSYYGGGVSYFLLCEEIGVVRLGCLLKFAECFLQFAQLTERLVIPYMLFR